VGAASGGNHEAMTNEKPCPACDEGRLLWHSYTTAVEYFGRVGLIWQKKLRCNVCNAELYDEECGRANHRALVRFQKQQEEREMREDRCGPMCKQHPDAPHGFDRKSSHSVGRYVCECEGWTEPK
jgi:hypothetical protein